MTKKLIRVKADKYILNGYKAKLNECSLYFSFIGPDEEVTKDGLRRKFQKAKFVTCREFLCDIPRAVINNFEYGNHIHKVNYNLDFNTFRLLIGNNNRYKSFKNAKNKIFSGKRALNLLEEAAGWEQSIITTVKHEDYVDDSVWLLTGDKRWMMVPQMISLACLILRLGYNEDLNTDSLDDLMKSFDCLAKKYETEKVKDYIYIGHCRKHIINLMKNVYKVFDEDKTVYFPPLDSIGWNGCGGIDTLVTSATNIDNLTKNFKKYVLHEKN